MSTSVSGSAPLPGSSSGPESTPQAIAAGREQRAGIAYGLAAYLWWGFCVVYFKAVAHVPAFEVLGHRIVWSVVFLGLLLGLRGRLPEVRAAFRHRRTLLTLMVTACLVSTNWVVFIWSVANDHVVEASLGYFINPLVNVLLGFMFLKERLRPVQWFSVALAAAGVVFLTLSIGHVPVIALTLAFSFGFYGLLRKVAGAGPTVGLAVETLLLLPLALGYLVFTHTQGELVFMRDGWPINGLLMLGGVITALPLLWFANAAKRLPLATIGFLQYLAPSLQLMLGVLVYGEAFGRDHQVAFACIWTALIIYSFSAARRART